MKKRLNLSNILFEQDIQTIPTVNQGETVQPQNYSLDQKVDKYLVQYERESNPQAAQNPQDSGMDKALVSKSGTQGAGAGFEGGQSAVATPISMPKAIQERKKTKKLYQRLWEQEDPLGGDAGGDTGGDPLGGGGGDLGGDLGGSNDAGGGDQTPPPPPVPKPQINLSIFTNKVARLINNFETLVDPKTILVNRAYGLLRQEYDERTAKEFLIILENTYQITNKSKQQKEEDLVGEIPTAVGAGPDTSGGGG